MAEEKTPDIPMAQPPSAPSVAVVQEEEQVFIENMDRKRQSRFHNNDATFVLEPHGYEGSITQVPSILRHDGYLKRAEKRGKVRFIDKQTAYQRFEELEIKDSGSVTHAERLQEALGEDASERVGRYSRDLPEDAEERGQISMGQVWKGKEQNQARNRHADRTSEQSVNPPEFNEAITDPSEVLTETQKGEPPLGAEG